MYSYLQAHCWSDESQSLAIHQIANFLISSQEPPSGQISAIFYFASLCLTALFFLCLHLSHLIIGAQNLTSTFDTLTDRFRTAVGLLPIIKDLPLPSKRKIQARAAGRGEADLGLNRGSQS
jgi:hypothetical protein